ncbi:MAG: PorT family protein [Chitinophagaceae bacterium]|nr:PorT family protein [Chitinophagaceae bacterium]
MKKVLVLVAAVVLVSAVQAQKGSIKFGVKAGANFYKFSGDDADFGDVSPKIQVGIAGGGLVNIPVSDMFSVQPEILFSMEGAKYEESGDKLMYKTNYINIPVLFQYNNASGFYAETGPQIGFLMSAKADDGSNSTDVKDSFKGTNFSWALGLGYKTKSGFGFGARYNLGLGNIIDETDVDIKLGGFHVGVFYLFGGEKK